MLRIIAASVVVAALPFSSALAAPAAPLAPGLGHGAPIELVAKRGKRVVKTKRTIRTKRTVRTRRSFRGRHNVGRRFTPGGRYRAAPRGWRRYRARPGDWRTRGCVIVGPVWFCP